MEGLNAYFFMITEENKIYMCIHYNLMLVLVVNRSS